MHRISVCGFAILLLSLVAAPARAALEIGDAGDLPGTAQVVYGFGKLTSISGLLESATDVDMYSIFITNPANFRAQATGVSDSQMYLFNAAGLGVEGNDDPASGTQALLEPDAVGPTTPGLYYLAITSWNVDPVSAGGLIFPDGLIGPLGPTESGGGQPVIGWTNTGFDSGSYEILLRGAKFVPCDVPEPASIAIWSVLGVVGALAVRRGRRR